MSQEGDVVRMPENQRPSPAFKTLITELFDPLTTNLKNYCISMRKGPKEVRTLLIVRFFANWRKTVGNNMFPVLRLILPRLDKDRQMYGLKEKSLGSLIVKMLNIAKNSPDAKSLLNYKFSGTTSVGNFSLVCSEIIAKRITNTDYSSMTIDQVNELLDELSSASKMDEQLPIFSKFYNVMNSVELMWIVRIILRYVQIGASEKTFFDNFHPDAMALYSVTSSLSKVCAELYDTTYRLPDEQNQVSVMSCFQPQMALYIKPNYERIVSYMPKSGFLMEEKMDGERIQIHITDSGNNIKFFSRNAKDYTYLYGSSYDDPNGTLTKHLKDVISTKVHHLILDGEMVAWDDTEKVLVPFGALKTAAKSEQTGGTTLFPMFMAFDVLVINGKSLVDYSLSDRKKALQAAITEKPGHFLIVPYTIGTSPDDIGFLFEKVIAASAEGLVIKNPDSRYMAGERNTSWIKVKPDYMDVLGEYLDVCIVGGYYGNGNRGGILASFLVGVRADVDPDKPEQFYTLCKVGGGFSSHDFVQIRQLTKNKWLKWDSKRPPVNYVVVPPGGDRPDVWIKPSDSLVIEIKGTQLVDSTSFMTKRTVRFPRFQRLRDEEKDWKQALSLKEFRALDSELGDESIKRKFDDSEAKKTVRHTKKKKITIIGGDEDIGGETEVKSDLFRGYVFYVAADGRKPCKISKLDLEARIKQNGGQLTQNPTSSPAVIIIADRTVLQIREAVKLGEKAVFQPKWVLDSINNLKVLPIEPAYLYHGSLDMQELANSRADEYGDSWERQIDEKEFLDLMDSMDSPPPASKLDLTDFREELLLKESKVLTDILFLGLKIYYDHPADGCDDLWLAQNIAEYGGAETMNAITVDGLDYVVIFSSSKKDLAHIIKELRASTTALLVSSEWIECAWKGELKGAEILRPPQRFLL